MTLIRIENVAEWQRDEGVIKVHINTKGNRFKFSYPIELVSKNSIIGSEMAIPSCMNEMKNSVNKCDLNGNR